MKGVIPGSGDSAGPNWPQFHTTNTFGVYLGQDNFGYFVNSVTIHKIILKLTKLSKGG